MNPYHRSVGLFPTLVFFCYVLSALWHCLLMFRTSAVHVRSLLY